MIKTEEKRMFFGYLVISILVIACLPTEAGLVVGYW